MLLTKKDRRYSLVVVGRVPGEREEVEKRYQCVTFPENMDEVQKIAEDFSSIRICRVEKTVIVRLK